MSKNSSDQLDQLLVEISEQCGDTLSCNDGVSNHTDNNEGDDDPSIPTPNNITTESEMPTFITDCHLYRGKVLDNFNNLVETEQQIRDFVTRRKTMKQSMGNLVEFLDCIQTPSLREGLTDYLQQVYLTETDLHQIKLITEKYAEYFKLHQANLIDLESLNFFSLKPKCPLCFTNDLDTVCIPCGHSACRSCLIRCNSKCGVCRHKIKGLQKLFIN